MTWLDLPFRSGMSSKSDLRGAIEAGVPVGVVAGLLTTSAMVMVIPRYLDRLRSRRGRPSGELTG